MRKILILSCLLIFFGLGHAYAADPVVKTNEVKSDFGKELRFDLEVTTDAKVTDVAFLYTFGVASDDLSSFLEAPAEWNQSGSTVTANFVRDTSVEYLPINVTVRYKWVLTLEDGTSATIPEQSFKYDDTRFQWRELTERNITVRWYQGDDKWGKEILDSAVAGLDRLEKQINTTVPNPMTIAIYANTRDMRAALPPNSADWIGGQARPDLGLIIGSIDEGDSDEVARLVPHELSHLVLHQATENNYGGMPVWFDEGMAVVNQAIPDRGFDSMVENAARDGELIPLRALASNFPSDPNKALQSYAQSGSVIRFIESKFGSDALAKLVELFKSGMTDDDAVQTALGISLDDLDAQWRETLPKAERTPDPVTAKETAPSDRFKDKAITIDPSNPNNPINTPNSSGTSSSGGSIPMWVWMVGILGLLLIAGGFFLNQQQRA